MLTIRWGKQNASQPLTPKNSRFQKKRKLELYYRTFLAELESIKKKSKRTDELYQKLNKGKDLHCLDFVAH